MLLLLVCLPSLVILAGFGPGPRHYSLGSLAQVIVRLRMDQVLADLEALVQADDELVLLRLLDLEVFYQSRIGRLHQRCERFDPHAEI